MLAARPVGAWRVLGSKPGAVKKTGGVLVVGEGVETPLELCRGTLVQGTEPNVAHRGPCAELATHPEVHLPSPSMRLQHLSVTLKGKK